MVNPRPRANAPTAFLALTFLLSAPLYLLDVLANRNVLGGPEMGPVYISVLTVTPALAACLLTVQRQGREGFKELIGRILDFRRVTRTRWYLPTLLLGPLVFVLSAGLMAALGAPLPSAIAPLLALPAVFAFFIVLAAGEELGWMGYAFKPLQARHGALAAALMLGVVWGAWHAPFFVFTIPDPIAFGAQILAQIGTRVLVVWIFCNTGRSVFAAILYHAADNTALVLAPDIKSVVPLGMVVQCGFTLAVASAVALMWDSSTLTRFRLGASAKPDPE
jgi:membrane protease YdiL (CAAX protease family)